MIKTFKKLLSLRMPLLIGVVLVAGFASFGIIHTVTAAGSRNQIKGQKNCNGTCVNLYEDKATPDTIAVAVGSYVQFSSKDGKSHSLSLGEGGEEHIHSGKFSSGEFKADEGWRVQFNDEGSFYFHDHLNPKISVLVVVYTPGKQYKVE